MNEFIFGVGFATVIISCFCGVVATLKALMDFLCRRFPAFDMWLEKIDEKF